MTVTVLESNITEGDDYRQQCKNAPVQEVTVGDWHLAALGTPNHSFLVSLTTRRHRSRCFLRRSSSR